VHAIACIMRLEKRSKRHPFREAAILSSSGGTPPDPKIHVTEIGALCSFLGSLVNSFGSTMEE
jgi:hypothetical protein